MKKVFVLFLTVECDVFASCRCVLGVPLAVGALSLGTGSELVLVHRVEHVLNVSSVMLRHMVIVLHSFRLLLCSILLLYFRGKPLLMRFAMNCDGSRG